MRDVTILSDLFGTFHAQDLLEALDLAVSVTSGESLREKRERAGLTQQQLADKVGCRQQSISDIESGRITPSTSLAIRLYPAVRGWLGQGQYHQRTKTATDPRIIESREIETRG